MLVVTCRSVFGNELLVLLFELGGILTGEQAHPRIGAVLQWPPKIARSLRRLARAIQSTCPR